MEYPIPFHFSSTGFSFISLLQVLVSFLFYGKTETYPISIRQWSNFSFSFLQSKTQNHHWNFTTLFLPHSTSLLELNKRLTYQFHILDINTKSEENTVTITQQQTSNFKLFSSSSTFCHFDIMLASIRGRSSSVGFPTLASHLGCSRLVGLHQDQKPHSSLSQTKYNMPLVGFSDSTIFILDFLPQSHSLYWYLKSLLPFPLL